MDLNIIWFMLIGVLLGGYAVLDGFDLGVGVLHLLSKGDKERRIGLNTIGPVWDGNEVWLLTGGGAMFAAFPILYATVFSGFYLAFMLLLVFLIFRAVSMEFRSKVESPAWRTFWDWAFAIGSFGPALLYGVAVGNVIKGLPIQADGTLNIGFIELLNPFSLLCGVVGLVFFTMHGNAYLILKSDGEFRERIIKRQTPLWMAFVVLYAAATSVAIVVAPYLFEGIMKNPLFWVFTLLLLGSIVFQPIATKAGKHFLAFLASSATILSMVALTGLSLFPRWVPSSVDMANSLTIYNTSSTDGTLMVMLIIALAGVPVMLGYTFWIYRVFKGKPVINETSY